MYKFEKIKVDVKKYFPQLINYFKNNQKVIVAYLFGSYARGKEDQLSDIDLAILLSYDLSKREILDLSLEIAEDICKILNIGEVDLQFLNTIPLSARFEIITTGKVLCSKNENIRTDFEVNTMSQYWDFVKYESEYNEYLLKRIEENFTDAEREECDATIRKIKQIHQSTKKSAKYNLGTV